MEKDSKTKKPVIVLSFLVFLIFILAGFSTLKAYEYYLDYSLEKESQELEKQILQKRIEVLEQNSSNQDEQGEAERQVTTETIPPSVTKSTSCSESKKERLRLAFEKAKNDLNVAIEQNIAYEEKISTQTTTGVGGVELSPNRSIESLTRTSKYVREAREEYERAYEEYNDYLAKCP